MLIGVCTYMHTYTHNMHTIHTPTHTMYIYMHAYNIKFSSSRSFFDQRILHSNEVGSDYKMTKYLKQCAVSVKYISSS